MPWVAAALLAAPLAAHAVQPPEAIQAGDAVGLPLRATPIAPEAYAALCAHVQPACQPGRVALYEDPRGQTGWRYYLLGGDGRPEVWVSQTRDFAQARHWAYAAHGDAPMRLYPALYRAADHWAWAAISRVSESYSGGGAEFLVADFVAFAWNTPPRVYYAAVPFSCSKLVRACFGEKDYRAGLQAGHCHDEETGSLRIRQQTPASADDPGWQFTWREQSWPAFVPKLKTRTRSQILSIAHGQPSGPDAHARTAAAPIMCGGLGGGV